MRLPSRLTPGRRVLAAVGASTLVFALAPAASAGTQEACAAAPGDTSYSDVDEDGGTFGPSIDCVSDYGIVEGFGDGEFKPGRSLTRGQATSFVTGLIETARNEALPVPEDNPYEDVDADGTFGDPILKLTEQGIVRGTSDTMFTPGGNITRGEMAAIVSGGLTYIGVDLDSTDNDPNDDVDSDDLFGDEINQLLNAGVVQGDSDGNFNAGEDLRRGQMAAFIANGIGAADDAGLWAPTAGATNETFTDAPELVTAEVTDQDADSVDVLYTFDETVDGKTPAAGCFHLYAFDQSDAGDDAGAECEDNANSNGGHDGDVNTNATSFDGGQAQVQTSDPSNVLVRFSLDEEDFASITTTTVDWDAVQDGDGVQNLEGDAPIQSVDLSAGETTAPDLTSVEDFDATNDTVDFVFDEDIATVADQQVYLVETDGSLLTSTAVVVDEDQDNVVVATFGDGDISTEQEADTARAGVTAAVVTDDEGDTNPVQTVDVSGNGTTPMPNLTDVTVDDADDSATFTFDQAVDPNDDATLFQLYDISGDELPGETVQDGATSTTVEVAFADGSDLNEYVGSSVEADAVQATTGTQSGEGNEIDSLALTGTQSSAGETVGPQLTDARVEQTGSDDPFTPGDDTELQVVYAFDEDVMLPTMDVLPGLPAGDTSGRFFIYDAEGAPTRAGTCADSTSDDTLADNEVSCQFGDGSDETINDGVAVTVNDQGVIDDDDNANIEGATALEASA